MPDYDKTWKISHSEYKLHCSFKTYLLPWPITKNTFPKQFVIYIFSLPWCSNSGTPAGPRAHSFLDGRALLQFKKVISWKAHLRKSGRFQLHHLCATKLKLFETCIGFWLHRCSNEVFISVTTWKNVCNSYFTKC